MTEFQINGVDTLIISIFVLYLGRFITRRVRFLEKYNIPQAVTGGLIVSLLILAIVLAGGPKVAFSLELRDLLLLVFFSTIGLSAKFSRLKAGGRPLLILLACAVVFLVVQNATGVLIALGLGAHPGYGLFSGSVSFAGGHGTAIAWGNEAEAAGLTDAGLIGIAFATFGLVAGGIVGGPLVERLIKKHRLRPGEMHEDHSMMGEEAAPGEALTPVTMDRIMTTILILAICVSLGEAVNSFFTESGIKLPGFLTAMLVGIGITNLADVVDYEVQQRDFDRVGEVCLQLFLSMSLMSMDLNALSQSMGAVLLALFIQVIVITLFASLIVFRVMGRTYDAAVISAGFTGLGLGATPVAIANMNAVTSKYGPSFLAFLIVPLVGAFFIDLANAMIIKFFINLPIMQSVPLP